MCGDPRFFDGRTVLLVILFCSLAYLVSPASRWPKPSSKRRVAFALPPAVLLGWFLFQRELLFLDGTTSSFYGSMWGLTAWKLNSAICLAFGLAFSLSIVRTAGKRGRVYGIVATIPFLALLFGFKVLRPVESTKGLVYAVDHWMYASASEPMAGGKPLSYWAKRVNGLAEEAEPALEAIQSMGPEAITALIDAFTTGKGNWQQGEERPRPWEVRRDAAQALIRLGPSSAPAISPMLKALRDPDRNIREHAANILGAIGDTSPAVIDSLLRVLEDEETAYSAMQALTVLAFKDPRIIKKLGATGRHESKAGYWSMVALSQIGAPGEAVLDELIHCVQQAPSESRQPAVQAIALIGPNAAKAVPFLVLALKDSDEWTRKCIYIALGRIGPRASNAVPALRMALTNDRGARTDVARAIWNIDPQLVEAVLLSIRESLGDGDRAPREERRLTYDFLGALDLIGEIGTKASMFDSRLRQHLGSGDSRVEFNAIWSLYRIAPGEKDMAVTKLQGLSGLESYPLERIGEEDWGRALSELKQKRESFHLRFAAVGALWQIAQERRRELESVLGELLRDWDYFRSMSRVIPEEKATLPALSAILANEAHKKVHAAALDAQRRIAGHDGERW